MLKKPWASFFLCAVFVFATPVALAQLPDFTGLVDQNNAAVVNISTTQKVATNEAGPVPQLPEGMEGPEGVPLEDFLRRYFGEGGPGAPGVPPGGPGGQGGPEGGDSGEAKSLGSGFIISSDGYVMTNHHVIKDADEVIVKLQDRRELVAKVVGSDKRSDIALLKVDAKDLPIVKMGSADKLKVGEWVLAIGSPFGFDHSATAGIVSAKGRSLPSDNYVPFIQTDVAINPGNSGGPLFNLDGEVIGVNSQIYSRTGGFMGLSFAIPIDVAMGVVDQLKSQGRVSRGWLGVQIQDVTRELAESFGMKKPQGALVAKILPKSPSEEAGLQPGDIIEEYNGQEIVSSASLPPMVGSTKIGQTAKLKVLRTGSTKELTIKIGALPEEEPEVAKTEEPQLGDKIGRIGLGVSNPTAQQREQLQLPKTGGVLVQGVTPGPAYDAGIRKGDFILRIQDQSIKDVKQFTDIIKGLPKDKSAAVLVQRHGTAQFLAIKIKD